VVYANFTIFSFQDHLIPWLLDYVLWIKDINILFKNQFQNHWNKMKMKLINSCYYVCIVQLMIEFKGEERLTCFKK